MPEQQIVVVFDVSADSREEAAHAVANTIGMNSDITPVGHNGIDSWWFPESDIKHIDGNDNASMYLVDHELMDNLDDAYNQGDAQWLHACINRLSSELPKL